MRFAFTEEQLMFRDSAREFLRAEVTPEFIRAQWDTDTGRSPELWAKMVEMGLVGALVAQEHGGLGLDARDFVLIAEECGYAGLPEPLVENALVAAPVLMAASNERAQVSSWLEELVAGERIFAVSHQADQPFFSDGHIAHTLLADMMGQLWAMDASDAELEAQPSLDPSRRLFRVSGGSRESSLMLGDSKGGEMLHYGALGAAAMLLGCAQRMVEMTVAYTSERRQFGVPIGSFQALKHRMADVAVALEFARPVVYRAAHDLAVAAPHPAPVVSHAKLAAGRAALLTARNCIQANGAMGYTWEADLHIWMKRAWVLEKTWGTAAFHKGRVAAHIFDEAAPLGAGSTFA